MACFRYLTFCTKDQRATTYAVPPVLTVFVISLRDDTVRISSTGSLPYQGWSNLADPVGSTTIATIIMGKSF